MLNRTRIWIVCFNVDKSAAVQFGKPSTLREDQCVTFSHRLPCLLAKLSCTSIVRKSHEWYNKSIYNHPVGHFPFESLHGFLSVTDLPMRTSMTSTSLLIRHFSALSTTSTKKCSRTPMYLMV